MNCDRIVTILDNHLQRHLTTAERGALDEHLAHCVDCAHVWHAQSTLLALPIPVEPRDLRDGVLRALRADSHPKTRCAQARLVGIGALLVGAAALAAVGFITRTTVTREGTRSGDGKALEQPATEPTVGAPRASSPQPIADVDADIQFIERDVIPILITPPVYPAELMQSKTNGSATVQFDITDRGETENVTVVEATDPAFGSAAMEAVREWKYLPRIVAARRVPQFGVQTVLRFRMQDPPGFTPPKPDAEPEIAAEVAAAFERGLTLAWQRSGADDLRGAELALDELRASYALTPSQLGRVEDFYGYIYTLYGDYGRAIAAYEAGIAAYAAAPSPVVQGRWLDLAKLYFARHQYDMALRTLVTYRDRIAEQPVRQPLPPGVEAFIEGLRSLGVTEETL